MKLLLATLLCAAASAQTADDDLRTQLPSGAWAKTAEPGRPTIDNGATYTQLERLAKAHLATGDARYAASFRRGFEYLLKAQYANGGWPQFFPLRGGYHDRITYNDDATVGVLNLFRSIVDRKPEYAFLTEDDRTRAQRAIDKGIDVILKTQIVQDGKLTVWCAQHDERTLAPAKARSYELPSLSGEESVGIVRFLMGIKRPSPEVVRAVKGAVAWFESVKILGLRVEQKNGDRVAVADPSAPPVWARFYELGTNRPFFCGRDGVVKYKLSEIEQERRAGYAWYGDWPRKLLRDYPQWLKLL